MDRDRFIALWERCLHAGAADDAGKVFGKVLAHYSESHRRYHTPHHIDHCLGQFDLATAEIDDPDGVEMAIWFHDVIYNVPTTDNELRSAELFLDITRDRVDESFGQSVYDMIMITRHPATPTSNDERVIVDVDLSSFALPWQEFKKDSENVRDEFPDRADEDFYSAHMKFMRSLLKRKRFFASEFFRRKYEKNARENVKRLIKEYRAAGFS